MKVAIVEEWRADFKVAVVEEWRADLKVPELGSNQIASER